MMFQSLIFNVFNLLNYHSVTSRRDLTEYYQVLLQEIICKNNLFSFLINIDVGIADFGYQSLGFLSFNFKNSHIYSLANLGGMHTTDLLPNLSYQFISLCNYNTSKSM